MAENKQNSETRNTADNDKSTTGGAAASTKQAKEETSASGRMTNPTDSSVGKNAANTANDTFDKVKESAGTVANQALGQAKDKAGSILSEQKTNLASGISSVADSIRQVGDNLGGGSGDSNQIAALAGKYGDTLAGQVEKFSSYIEDKEIKELVRDVEKFARQNPLLFVGGAFALGIFAARFLKSSSQSQTSRRR